MTEILTQGERILRERGISQQCGSICWNFLEFCGSRIAPKFCGIFEQEPKAKSQTFAILSIASTCWFEFFKREGGKDESASSILKFF